MNKKLSYIILSVILTGCSTIGPAFIPAVKKSPGTSPLLLLTPEVNNNKITGLTSEEIKEFEKEYNFSTKALNKSYLKRKLNKWLDTEHNGAGIKENQLVKEIIFARYKHDSLFCEAVSDNGNQLLDIIKGDNPPIQAISERIALDPSFGEFLDNCQVISGQVTTIAGDGTAGYLDGIGTNSQFNNPSGVAVDNVGNVYVADSFNNIIRKISRTGVVTTLAGDGTSGYLDGNGTISQFRDPRGIAVDSSGNIYVADSYNNIIRKISNTVVVTTLAGDGTAGYLDGSGTNTKFNLPYNIGVDSSGNVYVADAINNRIRKINSTGVVTTLAGDGTGDYSGDGEHATNAQFNSPAGVTVDSSGNVYVADHINQRIRKISSSDVVTTLAGDGTGGFLDGNGTNSHFFYPSGGAVDTSGNVYVADGGNCSIRKISSIGEVTTLAGNGNPGFQDGIGTNAQFNAPFSVAVDTSGNVYVADRVNNRIRKISP